MTACEKHKGELSPAPAPMKMPKFGSKHLDVIPHIKPGKVKKPKYVKEFANVIPHIDKGGDYDKKMGGKMSVTWQIPQIPRGAAFLQEELFSVGDLWANTTSLEEEEKKPAAIENSLDLGAGGHCVDAWVMVTPGARQLSLQYKGVDTGKKWKVVPGQMVH